MRIFAQSIIAQSIMGQATIGKSVAAIVSAALVTLAAVPAHANPHHDAEQLRKLDIMLMVTALRCRHGGDNFQRDYEKFSIKHNATMQGAAQTLKAS